MAASGRLQLDWPKNSLYCQAASATRLKRPKRFVESGKATKPRLSELDCFEAAIQQGQTEATAKEKCAEKPEVGICAMIDNYGR